ncbi:MAG TPA: UDP-N-acetylmuramoyl-L-alanyl-D-glutamate--2,6-diaminopimelate ligase [Bryobacteraceae bacterium]|jgi:UDP-N-acetylmuramoyl-L-alanyl-D-glutamate--2,6-diaminopimelate ligase|nr:UDP-N-acetylmuramoyl-L-alanyl-D-glutamate--2,6-diaminopimelate ligase [Bryobacteraceae bacterium]
MTLRQVLEGVRLLSPLSPDLAEKTVGGIEYDSRRLSKDNARGFVFFAFAGSRVDGRRFVEDAAARGAFAFVSELAAPEGVSESIAAGWIQVEHGRRALAAASRNFCRKPDERVLFTGITGTNGKTTTSYLVDAILSEAGFVTGLIGTIESRLAGERREVVNTTPESLDVMRFAAELEGRALEGTPAKRPALTMEVSSHALALGRVFGIRFHTAVFTNLTRDHLDFHHTMDHYAAAKARLFSPEDSPGPQWSVLNADDPASSGMAIANHAPDRMLWYGLSETAQIRAENIDSSFAGLRFDLVYDGARQPIESGLVGRFNVMNILAAAGVGISYGIDLDTIARGIAACRSVPGRFERIGQGQPFLVAVDYAHTDDALRNAIQVARELVAATQGGETAASGVMTTGRVITVFGCGGDRDRSKRPLMGMAAGELSDYVVLTSDNPRSEDPLAIMNDALVGLRRFDTPHMIEPDRARAIRHAIEQAAAGDAVLIAGKGHETYQVLKDRTIHFDDRETAREVLRTIGFDVLGFKES